MALLRPLVLLLLISSTAFATPRDGVNAVLGDDSYVARFGVLPDDSVDEDLRLRVHLEYVEALLRAADPGGLTAAQRTARARNLDLLRAYHQRGVFPRNHTVPGRRPHFIDEAGRICAVGYLIEQTAGRAVAEVINARHEWSYLPDIDGITEWVAQSGLGVHELAMIQPGYQWRPSPVPPHPYPRPRPRPDPEETRRLVIARVLASLGEVVQTCADDLGFTWRTRSVPVTVTLFHRGADVRVGAGGRAFRSCVAQVVRDRIAGRWSHGRFPLTVSRSFTVLGAERYEPEPDPRFAQPPDGWMRWR